MSRFESEVLIFTYFHHPGKDGMRLAYSRDGLKFTPLNGDRPVVAPGAGVERLIRDPFIYPAPDGVYHMVWTTGWNERCIGYACSTDLVNWSEQRELWVMGHEPGALNCWAPEIFYDAAAEEYMIFWSTTIPGRFPETDGQNGKNHRIYYTTTKDFNGFGKVELLYNDGFNVIDANIIHWRGRYIMFMKDETNVPFPIAKNIRFAVADHPKGPYSSASRPITGDYWAEGPCAVDMGDELWVYFDKHREGKYGIVRTRDLEHWEDISDRLEIPRPARHGALFWMSNEKFKELLARLG